jgi:hypothetical protein
MTPAAVAWLAGVGLISIRWLSPLSRVYSNAILADLLFGVAFALLVAEHIRGRRRFEWRPWHLWLAAYVGWTGVAAVAAPDHTMAGKTFLLVTELALVAVVTAELAASPAVARALARVVLASVALTTVLAIVGLALFYAGHRTGLLGAYGEQFQPSKSYARVRAGFESPPLLASWCIAASAILAWAPGGLPRRARIAGQVALGCLVLTTFSRGALAFGAALVIRWAAGTGSRGRRIAAAAAVAGVVAVLALLTIGRLHADPARPSSITYQVPDPGNRREAAITSWHTFEHHPVFGSGPGSYPGINRGLPFRAHLTPLNIAATTGLPALVALAGMVIALWRGRSRPTDIAIWSGLAALALDGLAQDIDHFRHVWLLIGLAAVHPALRPARAFGTERADPEVLSPR